MLGVGRDSTPGADVIYMVHVVLLSFLEGTYGRHSLFAFASVYSEYHRFAGDESSSPKKPHTLLSYRYFTTVV